MVVYMPSSINDFFFYFTFFKLEDIRFTRNLYYENRNAQQAALI